MAMERCILFHGREDILHEIASYLQAQKGQPLVLYGQSGCGKTSIIAQTAKMVIYCFSRMIYVICALLIGMFAEKM